MWNERAFIAARILAECRRLISNKAIFNVTSIKNGVKSIKLASFCYIRRLSAVAEVYSWRNIHTFSLRLWSLLKRVLHLQTGGEESIWARLQEVMCELPQLAASICALGVDERLLPDGALGPKSPLPKKEEIMCLWEVSLHPSNFNVFLMRFRRSLSALEGLMYFRS